jgi:Domain of unknown function (DUF4406)
MHNRKICVYIAGPYTSGDPVRNTHAAMKKWMSLWIHGFIPICPHWTMFQHFLTPLEKDEWLEYDQYVLAKCDAVLRLPGASEGADAEVEYATHNGIPVFFNDTALLEFFKHAL